MKRIRAIVKGAVQGVGYRAYIFSRAQHLGVTGYVRNLPDGSVEICAEGVQDALDQVVDLAWSGPMLSRVQDVLTITSDATGEFGAFEVKY